MANESLNTNAIPDRDRRREVERRFSSHAKRYREVARVQREAADRLARALDPWRESLPSGPVLEVGAGTGLFSRHLDRLFPARKLWVTDLSQSMLDEAVAELNQKSKSHVAREFRIHDAESGWFDPNDAESHSKGQSLAVRPGPDESPQTAWDSPGPWALVTGNFVAQWFRDPSGTLSRLATGLAPGGLILMAMPGMDSFPEWKERCRKLNITFTGNQLPDTERLVIQCSSGPFQVDYHEEPFKTTYESALHFFQELRDVGASTPLSGKQLSARDFRRLVKEWDQSVQPAPVQVTWHLLFLAIRRDL